ncbi:respiratory nitrate reductase subunit gamma [Candidatus Pyrohabitans sp.]
MEYMVIPPALKAYFYAIALISTLVFATGAALKLMLISSARDTDGLSIPRIARLSLTSLFSPDCLLARRVFPRSRLRGAVLVLILWSFLIIIAIGVVSYASRLLGVPLRSTYHLLSLFADVAGFLLLLGVLYAAGRRYLFARREVYSMPEDGIFLTLFLLILLSGFAVEGARLAITSASDAYSPFGSLVAGLLSSAPLETQGRVFIYAKLVHFSSSFALLAYLPFSKAMHMLAAQLTTRFAREKERIYY